jgi:hypothetical protein
MGVGLRIFLVENDGRLKPVSLKRFQALMHDGKAMEALPRYAGQRVRCAFVVLECENRKPTAIERIDCAILNFDESGRLNSSDEQRQARLAIEALSSLTPKSREGTVIDARSHFSKKLIAHEYSWQLSPDIENAIEKAIFVQRPSPLRLV